MNILISMSLSPLNQSGSEFADGKQISPLMSNLIEPSFTTCWKIRTGGKHICIFHNSIFLSDTN